ncbi:MAG: DNA mismatch repair protein MutS, partial [bacterium]
MPKDSATTPLMKQYLEIKAKYQHAILFFRMGDFYEMFYDDAKVASEVLGITLTSRSSGKAGGVPLAGFPYHSVDTYLAKMVKAGYRVAICEQIEDPKLAKTIVKRAVTEVVTPGTAISDQLLDSRRNNYLSAVFFQEKIVGIATVDVSTGEFRTSEVSRNDFRNYLALVNPAEILVSEEQENLVKNNGLVPDDCVISRMDSWIFNRDYGYEKLTQHFKTLTLKGYGCEDLTAGVAAAGAAIQYLKENQQSELAHLSQLQREDQSAYVSLDKATQRNLELVYSLSGVKSGTLISVLDQTQTPMGARLLLKWLIRPLRNVSRITQRHDAVEELIQRKEAREQVVKHLHHVGDLERLNAKVTTQRANARDMNALAASLEQIDPIKQALENVEALGFSEIANELEPLFVLIAEIRNAIVENPPVAITDGGIIQKGYHEELDRLREIAYSGKDWILRLQKSEREKSGIPSLKVSFNKVFGYYIEVTKPNLPKVPEHYIRKQTLVNAERFITPELKEYEEQVLNAEEKIISLEYELFNNLREKAARHSQEIQVNARCIATLDCLIDFARIAIDNNYSRPLMADNEAIEIIEGRHPVIEKLLPFGEKFVPNDSHIDAAASQIQIITGPNMAGKSTYLRQVALIVLMAQMG